jgi:hypothetical protein
MNSLVLRKTALARDLTAKHVVAPATSHLFSSQQKPARLRRKGPLLWTALALLVLTADFLLAYLAWLAVDFVMS